MARRLGFIVGSIALFGVTHRLVERVHQLHNGATASNVPGVFVEILLAVSVLIMVLGTTLLAFRCKNRFRIAVALLGAICILSAVLLDLADHTGISVLIALYFCPQLVILFFIIKRRAGGPGLTSPK
jgi:hypothetical protein